MLLGVGTACVYPTLLAAVSDSAHPDWRASAVGVYRLWRDGGYAVGALLTGVLADVLGAGAAIWTVAALTFYDMAKAVSHGIVIKDVRLLEKTGGKSDYRAR